MTLSDAKLRTLKPTGKPAKYSDEGGLFVLVTPKGSKLWRMAYRFSGKQKVLSFGSYPLVSLSEARTKREEAKKLLATGIDPSLKVKQQKAERNSRLGDTFNALADAFLAKQEKEDRSPRTMAKSTWLLGIARQHIGGMPIEDISAADILVPLRQVESAGNYETARRLRSTIGQVFRFAIANAKATNDPTFGLRGALITPKVKHRSAITKADQFAGMLRAVWGYDGTVETKAALKLMALLYPRPGELRMAEWAEFDLDGAVWTIPASRAKMRREHKKPLSTHSFEILFDLQRHTGNRRLVFPSIRSPERPISENTLNAALRRLGYTQDEATAHGFRASASSLLNESGLWQPDAIEAELGHAVADEVRRAYQRSLFWDERVRMAEWWGEQVTVWIGDLQNSHHG